jgi:LysR family glycine cleavage system transcriptional activator
LPSLRALQAFEAAARHGSFTRAAGELCVTQSAISRHVRGLEQWLGVPLFRRAGRRTELTAAGRSYHEVANDALRRLAEGTRQLRGARGRAVLTVSVLPSFAARWLVPRLPGFLDSFPAVDLRVSTTPALANFEEDEVDVAVRYGRGGWLGVDAELLFREQVFPVCSPAVAEGPPVLDRVAALAGVTLLHGEIPEGWETWREAAGAPDLDISRGPRFTDGNALVQAAVDGLGVGLGRTTLTAQDLAAGRLVELFEVRIEAGAAFHLVIPRGRDLPPGLTSFRDWIRAEATEFSALLAAI